MHANKPRYHGFSLAEVIVTLTIFSMLLVGFALSLHGFSRFNRYQLVKQQCIAAAQAQLDYIAVTGKPIAEADFKRLWPKLTVSIKQSDGTGQWQGLKRVEVTTIGNSFGKQVKLRLSRYILGPEQ